MELSDLGAKKSNALRKRLKTGKEFHLVFSFLFSVPFSVSFEK
jgi:hypothetical protein